MVSHTGKNTPNQVYCKDTDSDRLINALKAALKVRGVSMTQLSRSLHIPYRSLQNYFSGESRLPADVLLAICDYIGLETDYLTKGTFEISHPDLYDTVFKVLGDLLPHIEINPSGKAALRAEITTSRAEVQGVATLLALRLNEAYAAYRKSSFEDRFSKPRTPSELPKRKVGQ